MKAQTQKLFNDIINCPFLTTGDCLKITGCQNHLPKRQVPEPWNGDIEKSSFLIIGSNPALVDNEVYPSKDVCWHSWVGFWNSSSVQEFFNGRFGKAICQANGQPFVDVKKSTVLTHNGANLVRRPFQNGYWKAYNEMCSAISHSFKPWDFVVTDIVHCKSSQQIGVASSRKLCMNYLKNIISIFANNGAEEHHVLIIGSDCSEKNLSMIKSFGWSFSNKQEIGISAKGDPINMYDLDVNGVHVNLYHRIPAPSGANRSKSPIRFFSAEIKW